MKPIVLLLGLLIFLFPFGQLTRIPLPWSASVRLYAQDAVIALIFLAWIFLLIREKKHRTIPYLYKFVLIFSLTGALSVTLALRLYPWHEVLTGALYVLRWIIFSTLYPAVYAVSHKNKHARNLLAAGLFTAGVSLAIVGLAQYILYPNLRNLIYLGWDPHEFRVFGTFLDSGYIGLILSVTIMLGWVGLSLRTDIKAISQRMYRGALFSGISISAAALALTYSRSSYLALLAGSIAYSYYLKSVKPVLIVLVVIALCLVMLPRPSPTAEATDLSRIASVHARAINYQNTLSIIRDHPIIGVGFNMLRYENRNRSIVPYSEWDTSNAAAGADNSVLFVLATSGLAGFLAISILGYKLLKALHPIALHPRKQQYAVIFLASTAAIVTHSMFNNSLFYPWVMVWFWILLGIADAARYR